MPAKKKPEKALVCPKCDSLTFTSDGAQQYRGKPESQGGRGRKMVAHVRCANGHEQWSATTEARRLAREADTAAKSAAPEAADESASLTEGA